MPKFLNNVNLTQNELQNAKIQNLAADPGSGVLGQVYYNTTANELRVCTATSPLTFTTVGETTPDATTSVKGVIQLAGDLAGTSASPQIAAGAIVDADINVSAGIATSKISGFDTQVRTSRLDQMAAPTSSVSANSQKITNLASPTASTDAANKSYVDAAVVGIDWKPSVRVATTANITLSGTQTIDGVSVSAGDRVLVKNQTTGADNGVYVVDGSGWSRSADADSDAEVTGGFAVWVNEGTANGDSGWVLTTNDTIVVGTTSLTFTQFTGLGQITAGDGLTKTGNTLDVVGTADKITVSADAITIASTYAGQSSITTLGTIGTGTWQGTAVGTTYGGTGASTAAGARQNLGAAGYYSSATHSSGTTISVAQSTHGLAAGRELLVQVAEVSSGDIVYPDVSIASGGDVTITFSTSQTANSHRVTIIGKS